MRKAIDFRSPDQQTANKIIQHICSQFGSYMPVPFPHGPFNLSEFVIPLPPQGSVFEVMEDLECPGLQDFSPMEKTLLCKGDVLEILNQPEEQNGYMLLLASRNPSARLRVVLQSWAHIDWRGVKATYKPRTAREMVMKSLELNADMDQGSPIKMSETALCHWRRAVWHFRLPYTLYSDHPEQINTEKEAGELVDAIKLPQDLHENIIERLSETLFTQHSRDKWSPRFFIESQACHCILADIEVGVAKGVVRAYFVPADAIILEA